MLAIGNEAPLSEITAFGKYPLLLDKSLSGLFLLVWGLGCLPLSFRFFFHLKATRNINLLAILTAILLVFVNMDSGNSAVFGTSNETRYLSVATIWKMPSISKWFILAAILGTGSCFLVPFSQLVWLRKAYSVFIGICFAVVVIGTQLGFFRNTELANYIVPLTSTLTTNFNFVVISTLFVVAFVLLSLFVVFARWPSVDMLPFLPWM